MAFIITSWNGYMSLAPAPTILKEILKVLPENFIRCHKSYIINKNFIANYDITTRYVAVKSADELTSIPIGQSYYKSLMSQLKY
jgi:DNA-binding LytR/AlgR family response regulator